jgi:hypothetical protein
LLLAALLLVLLSVMIVLRPERTREQPFQRVTGGTGLSAAVSAAWSFFAFDPRTESACENELWPIPGLPCPTPYHGTAVFDPPPLFGGRR